MYNTYLAFDLGATSWRAMLGQEKGDGWELDEIYREENRPVKKDKGLFWNIEKIYAGMKNVLKNLSDSGVQPVSLGIDSWSVDYGLIDAEGVLVEQPRCYRDPRNQGMAKQISEYIDIQEIFLKTGVMIEDITTLCQIFAARQTKPDLFEHAYKLLFIPDLLRYWLCGKCATDFTLATTSQLYNLSDQCWDRDLLSFLQIPPRILPEIQYGSSVLGTLRKEIQQENGMGPLPITMGASHDTAAAFSTVKGEATDAILSSGTWSIMGVSLDKPIFSVSMDPERFGYEGNPDGTVRLVCNIPGMWILEQCRSIWEKQGMDVSYESLEKKARKSAYFKSTIDPYYPDFRYPTDMTDAIRIYCKETGQDEPRTTGEFTIAVLNGLAEAYSGAIKEIEHITEKEIKKIHIIGGGSRNHFLNELIAEKAGVGIVMGLVEATAMGNIFNQQHALKWSRA